MVWDHGVELTRLPIRDNLTHINFNSCYRKMSISRWRTEGNLVSHTPLSINTQVVTIVRLSAQESPHGSNTGIVLRFPSAARCDVPAAMTMYSERLGDTHARRSTYVWC